MEIGKYGVNPDYTEHAGTHDDNEHRYNALAHGSGRRNGTVHKCRNTIRKSHDRQTVHTGINNSLIPGKQGQKRTPENYQ